MELEDVATQFYNETGDKWFLYLYDCVNINLNIFNLNINEVELRLNYLTKPQFLKLLYFFRNSDFIEQKMQYTNISVDNKRCTKYINQETEDCIEKNKGQMDFKFDRKLKEPPFKFRISFANEKKIDKVDFTNKLTTTRKITRYSFISENYKYELSEVQTKKSTQSFKNISYEFEIELLKGSLIQAIHNMLILSSYLHGYKITNYTKSEDNYKRKRIKTIKIKRSSEL